jgi:copper chaperone NosL
VATRRQFLGILSASVVAVGSVSVAARLRPAEGSRDAFPSIRYGEESCSYCGMSIGDERFASAWRLDSAERHFDDIGCMTNALLRDEGDAETQFYVHDYVGQSWLDARMATFILSDGIKTPMAYGVAALGDHTEAHARADSTPGMVALHWPEIVTRLERKS